MSEAIEFLDATAATALYQRCYGELVGYLERLLGERAAAEDCAQEAGMRLIEAARADPLGLRVPRAFLFHVATNLARDLLRRRLRREGVGGDAATDAELAPATDVVVGARQELALIAQALNQLPPRPREILLLSRVEGLTHAEIGTRLGIAPKTVENHVGRALAMLAQRLDRRREA